MYKIFVYGTLKKEQPNEKILTELSKGTVTYIGKGKIEKRYPLVIASVYNLPCLLPVEGNGKNVVGDIIEVDQDKLDWLDNFEDHPNLYERVVTTILQTEEPDGVKIEPPRRTECWVYFYKEYDDSHLKLPFYDDYDNNGPHGLEYDEEEAQRDIPTKNDK